MAEIFGRVPLEYGGAFSADAAIVTFGGVVGGGAGLITQNLNATYQQRIDRIYEVGSRFTFYIAGRSQGQGALQRILGPRPIQLGFYTTYGNPCNAGNALLFTVNQGCVPGDVAFAATGVTFSLNNVLLSSFGLTVAAENMMINENLQFMFISLTV